jgi:uncharacterized protein with HEPN domain
MDSRDEAVLKKLLEEVSIIGELIAGSICDTFVSDEKTKRAVCMTLINIGEKVKLLSDSVKQGNPTIPWRSITGLRDVTAHGYQTLRMEDIWETVTVDIPLLQEQLQKMLT